MIATLRGRLLEKSVPDAVIDVGGVGYLVTLTTPDFASLPAVGADVFLHTFLHVRDDVLQLYGFRSADSKNLFIQLISVTNVGPKLAMGILSHFSAAEFSQAIASEDVALLATVPGVGKKSAGRLVLELREKMGPVAALAATGPALTATLKDIREALLGLGYSVEEAALALSDLPADLPVEEGVKAALKKLERS